MSHEKLFCKPNNKVHWHYTNLGWAQSVLVGAWVGFDSFSCLYSRNWIEGSLGMWSKLLMVKGEKFKEAEESPFDMLWKPFHNRPEMLSCPAIVYSLKKPLQPSSRSMSPECRLYIVTTESHGQCMSLIWKKVKSRDSYTVYHRCMTSTPRHSLFSSHQQWWSLQLWKLQFHILQMEGLSPSPECILLRVTSYCLLCRSIPLPRIPRRLEKQVPGPYKGWQ